jgi:DNA-directed RNA polymerase specialized sigma24 family protein
MDYVQAAHNSEQERGTDLDDTIRSYVEELSAEHQEIFHLRYGEWVSIRKIAARMGFKSPWSIQIRLAQISKHVAKRLVEDGISESDT